jgi:hypothetical protein
MFRTTEALASRGSLAIEPISDPAGGTFATRKGTDGKEYAQYGVGNSLLGIPFYYAGEVACRFISDRSAQATLAFRTVSYVPENSSGGQGHALLKRFAVSFTGAFILAFTSMLLAIFCGALIRGSLLFDPASSADKTSASRFIPALVGLAYGLSTIALPQARTFFSEPAATLFVLLAFALLATPVHTYPSNRRFTWAGIAFAVALLVRIDSLFVAPALGFLVLARLPRQKSVLEGSRINWRELVWPSHPVSKSALTLFWFVLPILAFIAWQATMNTIHFGSPLASGYADQREGIHFSTPIMAGLYGFTMSIGKSVFLFSPVVLLCLIGWPRFHRACPVVSFSLLLAVILKLAIQSKWQNWAGGWCWGPRHIFMIHALMMPVLPGYLARRTFPRRILFDLFLLAGIAVQIYGSSQNFIDFYILYYRTPLTAPQARVMYGGEDAAAGAFRLEAAMPDGSVQPVPLTAAPAPINDSIYVPQNSQWYRYSEMWDLGYTDNLWLRMYKRSLGREAEIK